MQHRQSPLNNVQLKGRVHDAASFTTVRNSFEVVVPGFRFESAQTLSADGRRELAPTSTRRPQGERAAHPRRCSGATRRTRRASSMRRRPCRSCTDTRLCPCETSLPRRSLGCGDCRARKGSAHPCPFVDCPRGARYLRGRVEAARQFLVRQEAPRPRSRLGHVARVWRGEGRGRGQRETCDEGRRAHRSAQLARA